MYKDYSVIELLQKFLTPFLWLSVKELKKDWHIAAGSIELLQH